MLGNTSRKSSEIVRNSPKQSEIIRIPQGPRRDTPWCGETYPPRATHGRLCLYSFTYWLDVYGSGVSIFGSEYFVRAWLGILARHYLKYIKIHKKCVNNTSCKLLAAVISCPHRARHGRLCLYTFTYWPKVYGSSLSIFGSEYFVRAWLVILARHYQKTN